MKMEWSKWCRLCAKDDGTYINIFIKNENQFNVADAVKRFFSIEIINTEELSNNICSLCSDYIWSLNNYAAKIYKVQQLFLEIKSNLKIGNKIHPNELRVKYELQTRSPHTKKDIQIDTEFGKTSKLNLFETQAYLKTEICRKQVSVDSNVLENHDFGILETNTPNCFSIKIENSDLKALAEKNYPVHQASVPLSNFEDSNDFDQDTCSVKSSSNESLNQNNEVKRSEKKQEKYTETKRKIYKTGEKNFECEECHQKFTRESNYLYHIKKSHKGLPPCEFCGKVCKTKQKLRLHLELHLPPEEREKLLYKCPHCTKKFTQSAKVKEHVRAIHLQEKPFVCEQCGKNFASQSNLCSHKRTHDNQSRLKCSICPKIFNNPHKLRFHIKHTHNSIGHPCSVCGQVLKTRKTLRNHMLIHSDDKPFKCNYCGKDFKRDKNLQIHMITHSGLKPFVCRFCSQSYANRSNCKKHEKHSHPNEYEAAAAIINDEPQQLIQKKLPNIAQLEAMLEQLKAEREPLTINEGALTTVPFEYHFCVFGYYFSLGSLDKLFSIMRNSFSIPSSSSLILSLMSSVIIFSLAIKTEDGAYINIFFKNIMEWIEWCRLCGKENGNQVDVFIKNENFPNISEAIQKYFSVTINTYDEFPTKICSSCNEYLLNLITFNDSTNKVQQMFLDLEYLMKSGSQINFNELRIKYGIENDSSVSQDNTLLHEIQKEETTLDQKKKNRKNAKKFLFDSIFIKDDSISDHEEGILLTISKSEDDIKSITDLKDTFEIDKELKCEENLHVGNNYNKEVKNNDIKNNAENVPPILVHTRKTKKIQNKNIRKKNIYNLEKDQNPKRVKKKYRDEEKTIQCEICSMKFVRENNLSTHLKKSHKIIKELPPCEYCGKKCKTKQKLKFHRELHLPLEERQKLLFKCPECGQKFTQKGAMRSHIRGTHSHERPFVCEACGKAFSSQSNLWSHRRKTHEENMMSCEICQKICKNSTSLRRHLNTHKEPSIPCSVCGILLKTKKTLKNHMLVHSDVKAYQCNYCGKEFKRDITLQLHMLIHSGLKPYVCRFCEQTYANPSNCKKHEKHSHPAEYHDAEGTKGSTQPQRVLKKLPNIKQLKAMLEDMKAAKENM
ncbi:zinc finger protein 41-like [Condylostylus longicornis]|uniref:zinc finger protein 41-like n=1 Tax=Condylostylus longicornis TaxID=2530218 RepID=UPI00244DDCE5|nr:zinc finger protein 41-like [Condylostylus longicornis]